MVGKKIFILILGWIISKQFAISVDLEFFGGIHWIEEKKKKYISEKKKFQS